MTAHMKQNIKPEDGLEEPQVVIGVRSGSSPEQSSPGRADCLLTFCWQFIRKGTLGT